MYIYMPSASFIINHPRVFNQMQNGNESQKTSKKLNIMHIEMVPSCDAVPKDRFDFTNAMRKAGIVLSLPSYPTYPTKKSNIRHPVMNAGEDRFSAFTLPSALSPLLFNISCVT
eukprot:CAMPEP_0204625274 /NCGR_PEP_ID=MMETSP0717-20131115/11036_1 /ASSEMBLY_ACC=CAM_ASM_000666 /TAXON_ID=230516 /ORGANISM="Chaetoceros curvisetus" /LENGTH=113 /DNA_ID=CAMNT_0051640939 /DNA_START=292 /DNA_END=633 /DNA_ORIENTATION=-